MSGLCYIITSCHISHPTLLSALGFGATYCGSQLDKDTWIVHGDDVVIMHSSA